MRHMILPRGASGLQYQQTARVHTGGHPRGPLGGYLAWVSRCNDGLKEKNNLVPWVANGSQSGLVIGYLQAGFAMELASFPSVFKLRGRRDAISPPTALELAEDLQGASKEVCTWAIADVLTTLRGQGKIQGWRNELFPVVESFGSEPLCLIERAAVPYFGLKAYGVHVNGYVEDDEGIKLWVARRSRNKSTWPGKLDHMVAGGQPYGISCADNVVKECAEEASVPEDLARTAISVGCVSYEALQPVGIKRDVLFCYDLKLPRSFQPVPQDGEVESFELLPISEVTRLIENTDEFKDNCNLVIIDFLIRHGVLQPDHHGFLELYRGLRSGDCS